RDPRFTDALLNRGLAHLELRRHEEALRDAERGRQLGEDSLLMHAVRGVALEGLRRHPEADTAFRIAFERSAGAPRAIRMRMRWAYGFAVTVRLPQEARRAFDDVLNQELDNPHALYGRAMLAMPDPDQADEALGFFNRALAAHPGLMEARRYR